MGHSWEDIKNKKIIIFFGLVFIIIFNCITDAQEEPVINNTNNKTNTSRFLSRQRENIGKNFRSITQKIDEYLFQDKEYDDIQQEDKFLLRYEGLKEEGKDPEFKTKINVSLYFPYLSILINNNERDNLPSSELLDGNAEEVSTGIKFYLLKLKRLVLSLGTGITIRDKRTVVYSRVKLLRSSIKIKSWTANFHQSVFWYSDNGFGELTQVDFDYPFSEKMLFRAITAGLYSKTTKGFALEQSFILSYDLVKRERIIFWRVSGFAHTEPFYDVDKYRTDIVYRVQLIDPWMFFDIAPQLEFPADENFRKIYGLRLGIDGVF
ncbi:MAG: hypothetical protein PHX78_03195 [bacterium]|nr:hypothetical protein [bacterium]